MPYPIIVPLLLLPLLLNLAIGPSLLGLPSEWRVGGWMDGVEGLIFRGSCKIAQLCHLSTSLPVSASFVQEYFLPSHFAPTATVVSGGSRSRVLVADISKA